MTELTADFETGVNGNTLSTLDAGSASPFTAIGANPIYDNAHVKFGTLAMRKDGVKYFDWDMGTVTEHYGRLYAYIAANPALVYQLVRVYNGASIAAGPCTITSTGKISLGDSDSGLGTSTNSVNVGSWFRVEWHVIHSTTAGFIQTKFFNSPDSSTPTETVTSSSDNNTLAAATKIRIGGDTNDSAGFVWIDNVVANAAGYPGSILGNSPGFRLAFT